MIMKLTAGKLFERRIYDGDHSISLLNIIRLLFEYKKTRFPLPLDGGGLALWSMFPYSIGLGWGWYGMGLFSA